MKLRIAAKVWDRQSTYRKVTRERARRRAGQGRAMSIFDPIAGCTACIPADKPAPPSTTDSEILAAWKMLDSYLHHARLPLRCVPYRRHDARGVDRPRRPAAGACDLAAVIEEV